MDIEIICQNFLAAPSPRLAEVAPKTAREVFEAMKHLDFMAAVQFLEFARYYKITGRPMAV